MERSISENIFTNLANFLGHHYFILLKDIGFSHGKTKYGKIWFTTGHIPAKVVTAPNVHLDGTVLHLVQSTVDTPNLDPITTYRTARTSVKALVRAVLYVIIANSDIVLN